MYRQLFGIGTLLARPRGDAVTEIIRGGLTTFAYAALVGQYHGEGSVKTNEQRSRIA